jgi:Bacterial Ig-like domain (group 3)
VPEFGEKFEGNFMKLARILSLLTGFVFVCHFSAALAEPITDPTGSAAIPAVNGIETAVVETGITGEEMNRALSPAQNGALIKASPSSATDEIAGTRTLTLTLPSGTDTGTLKIVLNGKNVTSRFSATSCNGGVCEQGALSSEDGLRESKNVLYAVAKKSDGTLTSSRLRFLGKEINTVPTPASTAHLSSAPASAQFPTASDFLPPTIALSTIPAGGAQPGQPWIQLGTQIQLSIGSSCSSLYSVIVLDRQTLVQKTAAPESSPACYNAGPALAAYLKTLPSTDLVIVGTNAGQKTDAGTAPGQFNTQAIGGTSYSDVACVVTTCPAGSSIDQPLGYIAIGVGGAAPGSAYENYYTKATTVNGPFATGIVTEDANGNYNFQSSAAVEYMVSPNDPSGGSTVTLRNLQSLPVYNEFTFANKVVFHSPSGQTNGFWLLPLQRDYLGYDPNCTTTANSGSQQTDVDCGTFYPTGSSVKATANAAYASLASALAAFPKDQLIFLVSVGTAAYSANQDPFTVASLSNFLSFGNALEPLGGTTGQTLSLYQTGSAYSLVTCSGCGNSMTGNAALSTSLAAQQGQTGFIHGVITRSLNGYFTPTSTSQESAAQNASGESANFTFQKIGATQPVEWPELTGSLTGGSSVAGEIAAYHYLSYQLVTQYYIIGAQGDFRDDIHYYFTGANNTYIDYHSFNPVNLPFPGQAGSCYTWTDPVTNSPLACFTQQDFSTVAQQVSTEIVDLDNVLLYMVNGSTNMKDVVASGNGSAALALIGAAATVQASTLQPPPATPVSVNWSNILSLAGSVVNIGVTVATGGLVPPDLVADVTEGGSVISGLFDLASATSGGLTSGGGSAPPPIPGPGYTFETTIGDLANSGLQQQLTAGFDTELDSLLGDWGKLSVIGPMITDSSNVAFYSPNQVAQNAGVTLLGQGSQRGFFLSLLPAYYSIQYFPGWYGVDPKPNYPDMGSVQGANGTDCNAWYSWSPQPPQYVSTSYPTAAGDPAYSHWIAISPLAPRVNFYIIGGTAQNPGKSNQNIPFIDTQIANTLFAPTGLNLPFDPFVTRFGPMKSVFLDTTVNGFDNFPANQTCSYNETQMEINGVGAPAPSPDSTATALSVPSSGVLGENVTMQATVTSPAGVPTGTVAFQDGNTQLGTATLDNTGNASFSATGLALGAHTITAYYIVNAPYYSSQSASSTVTVYANAPGIALTLSTPNLSVSYGTTSSPVTLQAASESGLAGTINFSCTGLPVGMTCNFNPATASVTAGSNMSTSFTVTSTATQTAGVPQFRGIGAIIFSVSLISLWRIRRGRRNIPLLFCLLLVSVVSLGGLLGCNGGSSGSQSLQETGSKTVLVTASSGSITRTIPLVLNIQ